MAIPHIIHYCWFGPDSEKPPLVQKCIGSWSLLDDYTIMEWNEATFDVSSHPVARAMYEQGKYAFVSDYVRLKVLYEFGGIYLDTDVEVKKRFDDAVLSHGMFISFQYDCALGTAIIGAQKGNSTIGRLLGAYDDFTERGPNNSLFTQHFLTAFPAFRLNNRFQLLEEGIAVYPKEYFDCPTDDGSRGYSVHHAIGSWQESRFGNHRIDRGVKAVARLVIAVAVRIMGEASYAQYRRRQLARKTEFYETYLNHQKEAENR